MRSWKWQMAAVALVLVWAQTALAGPTFDRVMKTKVIRAGIMTDSIPGGWR